MSITESEITLNFPDNNFFRLCDCSGYKSIQNHFMKEDKSDYINKIKLLMKYLNYNVENNKLNEEKYPKFSKDEIKEKKGNLPFLK